MVTETVDKDVLRGREIVRILKIAKESSPEKLLDDTLGGRSKDVETVCRLFKFIRDSFGPAEVTGRPELGSGVTQKYAKALREFLEEAGLDGKQINNIINPPPAKGCILDEFKD